MDTYSERKKIIKLYEKHFKEKLNISAYDDINFNVKLVDNIATLYKNKQEMFANNGDNNYILKEKITMKSRIDLINNKKSTFKYTPILISVFFTSTTFALGLIFQSNNTYSTSIIQNKIKNTTDANILNKANETLAQLNLESVSFINTLLFRLIILFGLLIAVYQLLESSIKKGEDMRTIFYTICYDTLCEMHDKHI